MNLWSILTPALLGLPALAIWLMLIDPPGRARLGLREGAAWSAVIWAAVASLVALVLSLGAGHDLAAAPEGHLGRAGLLAFWLPASAASAVLIWLRRALLGEVLRRLGRQWRGLRGLDRYLSWAIFACLALVGLVAVLSAPTTWDSMTYHLARVAGWLQLGGVSHYATAAEPQLFHPPGSEILIAQLQALTGGDRWAAGVQTCAYGLSIAIVSLIALQLGGGRRAQLMAAFLAASAPMAIMQGSSTQNDLLVGLWLMIAASLALQVLRCPDRNLARGLIASAAVALALLTKGTAWLYLPPILLLLAFAMVRRLGWGRAIGAGVAGLAIVLSLCAIPWLQNQATYGQFVYTGDGPFDYSSENHSPGALASGLARNAAIYLGTPSESVNAGTTSAMRGALSLGADPDDPATTFPGVEFGVPLAGPQEAHGPSLLLLLLGLWALVLVALPGKGFRTPIRAVWAAIIVVDVLLFAWLVKWQPWHSRLHLPVTLLGVPLIAVALEAIPARRPRNARVSWAVVIAASLLALPVLFLNVDRPLVGYAGHRSILSTPREAQYFAAWPQLERPYRQIVGHLESRGINRLAMIGGFDDWYYPFDALLGPGVRTSYVLVGNRSARYRQTPLAATQAVVCYGCDQALRDRLAQAGLAEVPGLVFDIPPAEDGRGASIELWTRERD